MKKLLLILAILLMVESPSWAAMPDGTIPAINTVDAQIKATPGIVYAMVVSYAGVTAGDKIQIKNSTDSSGTALITVVASTANGTVVVPLPVGVIFTTAIYYDVTVTGGAFAVSTLYM